MSERDLDTWVQLRGRFAERYPSEVARLLETLSADEAAELLAEPSPVVAASVLERTLPDVGVSIAARLDAERAAAVLERMDRHAAATALARGSEESRDRLLAVLPQEVAAELRELLDYPPDSAGHLMDTRVVVFRPEDTVGDVLKRLRGRRARGIPRVYGVDDRGHLAGAAWVQDLALADEEDPVVELSTGVPVRVQDTASRAELLEEFERRKVPTLPVVDFEGRLVGVIRHDALVEAAQAQATSDLQTMVGAGAEERALSPAHYAVRKRLPWLQVNLLTAFLAAAVVGLFEDTIARFTALAVLLPVVAGQSGNTGAQALAVTMRGLALREVRTTHWRRVAMKEVAASFFNGLGVAATTCLGVWLWSDSPGLTLVIAIAMVISMTLAGFSGAVIPMLLTALRQDPAQSSSIVLTTVTDVVGFASFLGIATLASGLL
ncbi:MAG: magnesium transporter [Myxococcota bacterium]|nr:magnesium transporter [Myxococcota bacterium]